MHDVFDLMMFLFSVFWILGWSVGVVILGALTALLLLYRESARLQGGCLVHVPRLGPLKIVCEYQLARMRNLRAENAGESGMARIRFDYEGLSCSIGDRMPQAQADNSLRACNAPAPVQRVLSRLHPPRHPRVSVRKSRRAHFQRRVLKGRPMPRSRSS